VGAASARSPTGREDSGVNELSIARRYAIAIFELAAEENRLDEVGRELAAAKAALESDQELIATLRQPATTREVKLQLVEAMATTLKLSPTVANALRLLAERNRLVLVPQIAEVYAALADERAGRVKARVTSAVPLSEEAAREIAVLLTRATRRSVVIERSVDPSILGGVVAQVGGKTFDGSLRTHIEGLKRQLKA
jgi:F-type H+-transporting ATPase subunit delta